LNPFHKSHIAGKRIIAGSKKLIVFALPAMACQKLWFDGGVS